MRTLRNAVPVMLLSCLLSRAQVNILTANGSNDRTNANLQETQLSPATVTSSGFGRVAALAVDGQVYAQPLYAAAVPMPGLGSRNLLIVATMHNSVYAFDADSTGPGSVLWRVNLGASVPATMLFGQYGDIGGEVGILGTPAVDLQRGVIYVVSDNLQNGAPVLHLHALDLTTGAETLGGPAAISAKVSGTGSGGSNGTIPFDPLQHIQRPGLLLANGAVYICFGSHGDQSPFHGWMMSYDAANVAHQLGVFMSTPNGDGGSIWQSGRGPAADDSGNVYALSGNGDYDGVANFGQSLLQFAGAAPARIGSYTPPNWQSMSNADADLSAGPALISGTHMVVGADKAGGIYLINGDAMGQGGAASAVQRFTASTGPIFNLAVWSRPGNSLVYVQGSRDSLKSFAVTSAGLSASPVSAVPQPSQYSRVGMTLSADGAADGTGILWEITGNYNDSSTSGTVHAYDASNLGSELWNSAMNPADDMGPVVKFLSPTVANGRVYVPNLANVVIVYGLLSGTELTPDQPAVGMVADSAGYSSGTVSPGELVSIFGTGLGPSTPAGMQLDASGNVSTVTGNTQVLFDGVAAPMVWTSSGQVNAIVPFGLAAQATQVQVQYQGQASDTFTVPVAASSPGIFSMDGSGAGQAIALNQDGSINSADQPAAAGSVVTLYATGVGQMSPPGIDGSVVSADNLPVPVLPVSVQIGGLGAQVLYAGGAPGIVEGVIQVNVRIPTRAPAGPAVPVVLQAGDRTSQQGLTIAVQAPTGQ
ncbi:MAG TPA: IPT/TIG domain-containing protein [Verrucomicrobiae bacterium]|nr:IPT/TIG domain-containing protein [Verrucomicrobiae bacterium]